MVFSIAFSSSFRWSLSSTTNPILPLQNCTNSSTALLDRLTLLPNRQKRKAAVAVVFDAFLRRHVLGNIRLNFS